MDPNYRFPGHAPFAHAAAPALGADLHQVGHALATRALSTLSSLAGQACEAPAKDRAGIFLAALSHLTTLDLAAATGRAILAEVAGKLGLPGPPGSEAAPPLVPGPAPEAPPTPKGAR